MQIDVGNVVADADGMNNIWGKYMDKLLNVENGEVDCPEVMVHCCLFSEDEFATAIRGLKIGKTAGPTDVVNETMNASPGFGIRWMTNLINNIVKKALFLIIGEKVSWCLCMRDPLICGSYRAISYWGNR